jgi:leucyl aminopeptidase
MNIEWSSGSEAASLQGDALCFIVSEAQAQGEGLSAEWAERISLLSRAGLFSGKLGQIYLLPVTGHPELPVVILAGSGNGSTAVHGLRP